MQMVTTHHEEADMPRKDIHSEVEGHALRAKRSDDAEPETTETQSATDEPEVEGQALRGRGAPVAEVEGHAVSRIKRSDDAESETADTPSSTDEPEVEGHGIGRIK